MRKIQYLTVAAGLAAVCMVASGAGQGDIYRWKDANGTWHYADQPVAGAELVKGTRKPPPAPTVAATTTAATATPAPAAGAAGTEGAVSPQVAEQVRQEAAAAKVEQCAKAEENYAKAVQARRMYKVDAQGVKTYLNDAELDETRMNSRAARDLACNP